MSTPIEREYQWHDDAACRDKPTEWWFPRRGDSPRAEVRAICRGCPVRRECLTAALERKERTGMWGGYTYFELRPYRLHPYCHQCREWIPRAEMVEFALADAPPRRWYCAWCRARLERSAS